MAKLSIAGPLHYEFPGNWWNPFTKGQWCGESMASGGRLNKKDGLTRCGDSHVKDKTS